MFSYRYGNSYLVKNTVIAKLFAIQFEIQFDNWICNCAKFQLKFCSMHSASAVLFRERSASSSYYTCKNIVM